ncbi:autotransporter assembly complex protein TamA [Frigidibacter sp. ROC022]|uniref:autotransporter assembly complex protein TamA n=1 Tax=Frigidibacter sp. ROC022 TaxID=2971796 RepID=UPI00215A6896|nr:autotransporter assembly complex family protein [Frigidibacter sp. ROC022]MCR8722846.1 autotransporter assembly complex protein TamA [Frigidibacter sp. ROC022]
MILPKPLRSAAPWFGALALACLPLGGMAMEARLETGADDSLKALLESGSLVLTAAATETAAAQDTVAAARADYANLLGILYGEGYYSGTISILIDGREAASLSPFAEPETIDSVVLRVDPGPRFSFGKASVAPLAPGTTLPEAFHSGAPARAALIRESVGAAVDGWREIGHAKAAAAGRRIVARHPDATLDAEVTIDPGPELTFGQLHVTGNKDVRADRIGEIAGLPGGKRFSPEGLDTAARRLRKTGAFTSVALEEAETPNPDGSLDVTAAVVEQLPRRYGFGAEVSSQEGVTLSAFWMHRNILHGAERLRFDGEISGIGGATGSIKPGGSGVDYTLTAQFARPGTFAAANTLIAKAEIAQLDEPDYFSRQGLVELGLLRELNSRTEVTAAIQYRYSEVEDGLGSRNFSHLMFPLTGQLDARDKPLDAGDGYYLRLEISPFLGLSGSASGGRIYGDGRYYRSFGADQRVTLAGRLQLGSIVGSGITGTPPDMLFHSGGGGTVRGQPYKSLDVDLGGGVMTGGRSLLVASAEARVRVTGKIGIVGFYDFGMVGSGSTPGTGDSHSGAGLGLRYATPLGPIRLDVAAPVSGDTGEGVQVYVGIGQSF